MLGHTSTCVTSCVQGITFSLQDRILYRTFSICLYNISFSFLSIASELNGNFFFNYFFCTCRLPCIKIYRDRLKFLHPERQQPLYCHSLYHTESALTWEHVGVVGEPWKGPPWLNYNHEYYSFLDKGNVPNSRLFGAKATSFPGLFSAEKRMGAPSSPRREKSPGNEAAAKGKLWYNSKTIGCHFCCWFRNFCCACENAIVFLLQPHSQVVKKIGFSAHHVSTQNWYNKAIEFIFVDVNMF